MSTAKWPRTLLRSLGFVAAVAGSAAITAGSLEYFGDELAPFVIEKLPLPHESLWLFALKAHVVAAALSFPACLALATRTLIRRAPRVHRWLGRVTGIAVIFVLVPSGFYLSLFAKGGALSTLGFMASGALVLVAMIRGVGTARAKDFVAHRRWVSHVLAQMSVAVSSRAMLFAFDAANLDPDTAYLVSLWLPVVASALFVEFTQPRRTHEPLTALRRLDPRQPRVRAVARA